MNQNEMGILNNPGEGNPQKIKVVMYHRVVDAISLSLSYPELCIHVDAFRHHLSLFERWGFTAITFDDYRLFQSGELNLPKKPVIITFDDGYSDTYESAFPILQEFGMKAVVFAMGDRQIKANTWDLHSSIPVGPLMNDKQIIELHAAGFEIGSHTMTHPRLQQLSHEQAWDEISRSRMRLEILLNAPVRTFAFPFGSVTEDTKKMLPDAGYSIGCATHSGPPVFGSDHFEIRRTLMSGSMDTINIALRMLTLYEYYSWARWKTKMAIIGKDGVSSDDESRSLFKLFRRTNSGKKIAYQ